MIDVRYYVLSYIMLRILTSSAFAVASTQNLRC